MNFLKVFCGTGLFKLLKSCLHIYYLTYSPHFPSAGPGVIARSLVVLWDDTLCSAGVLLEVSWLWDGSLEVQMDGALVLGEREKKRSVALLFAEIQHL